YTGQKMVAGWSSGNRWKHRNRSKARGVRKPQAPATSLFHFYPYGIRLVVTRSDTPATVTDDDLTTTVGPRPKTAPLRGSVPDADAFQQQVHAAHTPEGLFSRSTFPRPWDQFFDPQPGRKSRTSSPGLNRAAGGVFPASAILRPISSKSDLTHPTLETSISPSWPIQKTVGTLVKPYALEAAYKRGSSSSTGNVTPKSFMNAKVAFASSCDTPTSATFLPP